MVTVDGVLLFPSDARILLRTVDGKTFTLVLSGVEALRVNDLKKGNIILEVKVLEPKQLDASFIFEVYEYSDEHKKNFVLDEWVETATRKGLSAIEITPSYGCSVLAISKSHRLVDGRAV